MTEDATLTDAEAPRRRGRPPLARPEGLTTDHELTAKTAPTKRRRRSSVGGHKLKLQAPSRAGYTRRWVNDDGNRIAEAEELAYEFVTDPSAQSSDVGSRISRLVGTKANGEPLRAFLMETPDEEYQSGVADKEAHCSQIDEAMQRIVDETGQTATPKGEQYGQVSIKRDR